MFGIYFMLKLFDTKKWCYGVLTALMCALAIIMKSNYMIILIAVGLTLMVKAISEKYPVYLLYLLLAVTLFIGFNATAQNVYEKRTGFCLETQYYPDSVHHDNFPSIIFGPERPFRSTTIFKFGV